MDSQLPVRPPDPGRWLRLVSKDEFTALLATSVENALVRSGGLAPRHAKALGSEVLRRFAAAFAARTRRVRALTKSEHLAQLEKAHGDLVRKREQWSQELSGLEQELTRARSEAPQGALSPVEESTLARALEADLKAILSAPEPRALLGQVLAREEGRRRKALAGAIARERERIDLLERRLSKLRAEMAVMERRIAELAQRAALDTGVPSIYDSVQGLPAEEADREAKARMLATIFEQNLALQRRA